MSAVFGWIYIPQSDFYTILSIRATQMTVLPTQSELDKDCIIFLCSD